MSMNHNSRLHIDCTPFLINKTAMFRIINDFALAFKSKNYVYEVLGTEFNTWDQLKQNARMPWYWIIAIRWPKLFIILSKLIFKFTSNSTKKVFYWDPLYVLFKKNIDNDIVCVLDLTPYTVPYFHSSGISFLYKQAFLKIRASKCQIISISQSTTDDLRVNLGIANSRIRTIRLYPSINSNVITNLIPDPTIQEIKYFLFVGSLETRKNIIGAIKGFFHSGLHKQGYWLYIVGGQGHGADAIHGLLSQTPNVKILGYLSDDELHTIYKNAFAFIYPSFWEGFGIPLLEAYSYNLPTVATTTGATAEVAEGSSIMVDPCDIKSIAEGYHKLVKLTTSEKIELQNVANKKLINYSKNNFLTDIENALNEFKG